MLSKEFFDEWKKKRLQTLIREGKMPDQVIVGFLDPFGDAEVISCSNCGTPAFIRPWLNKFVKEHNIKVICICCVDDPALLKGQVAMDLANIEAGLINWEKKAD
jgi:hypothetical protein